MAKIKAIIFDLNGVFTKGTYLSERIEEKFGINKDLFWAKLKDVYSIARTNSPKSINLWKPITDMVNISQEEFFDFWFSGETLNNDLVNFAKDLKKQGFKVLVLSNNIKERVDYYYKNFPGFLGVFDSVCFSWETGFAKPDLQAFKNILQKNNLTAQECIFFDDQQINVNNAACLGIHSSLYQDMDSAKKFIQKTTGVKLNTPQVKK